MIAEMKAVDILGSIIAVTFFPYALISFYMSYLITKRYNRTVHEPWTRVIDRSTEERDDYFKWVMGKLRGSSKYHFPNPLDVKINFR